MKRSLALTIAALLLFALAGAALFAQQPQGQPTPEQMAQQEATRLDHRRMMELLKIASLRQGADGRNPDAPNAANYDESKANPYPKLPDPLLLKNGKKVTTAKMWWNQRRAEIVEDFDREIYGRMPKVTPKVKWEVASVTNEVKYDVPVLTKQLTGRVDNSSYPQITVDIRLTLTTPANAKGPVPVIMEFSFGGPRPGVTPPALPPSATSAGPPWQQQVLEHGWGYAILVPTSIQADNGAGLTQGIIGLVNKGQPRKPDDWGALRAWAWGASRALDYFETDKAVDAKRVSIGGHSRYGKAALVTMAYDSRFAIAHVSSSGAGGAKLHRRNFGELVENVAGQSEYHWMAGNYLKYAGPLTWDDLPVDSHELIALCAPRPVFIGAGATSGDGWVDAKGMFLAAAGAGPVYRLLGRRDLGTTAFPPIETVLIGGDLAFRQHSGGHTPGPNWPTFLTFASRFFAESKAGVGARTPAQPYKDPSLPIEKRVDDLVARMTLGEKVSQMVNAAAPIERLDVPAYDWWNEALHGVARAGYATVFPQAIGLAATWNADLIIKVADVVSTEARAKHHEFARQNDRGRYKGLTFWSPNINIFRDPRWGRGQETFGEDPYLTSRIGVAYVKGLQGDDPRYWKVVSTPKHYAVHSGPEPERHSFDAVAGERDLQETYLPAFRATVVEGKAAAVMCAYNRFNGDPCCASPKLYHILRNKWGFNGHVVSDCGAIDDIYKFHGFAKTEAEASAISVKAGTDLSCGGEYKSLFKAVKDGLISEVQVDVSLKRLMTARFRLGMFDPPELVRYSQIPISLVNAPEHRELALRTARESIVLLKNENNALPLSKEIRTLAVIGPNADAPEVLLGNYNGQPIKSITPLAGIREKVGVKTKVLYALGSTLTGSAGATVPASATPGGFKAEYFNNKEMQGQPVLVRTDEQVNFDWSRGRPAPEVNEDGFSVRWTGKFTPPETGQYELGAMADDGVRVYLDGQLLVDAWATEQLSQIRTVMKEVRLERGRSYDVRIEYYENVRNAIAKFFWSFPGFTEKITAEAVDIARQADAVVLVLGISPALEGEEMTVNVAGFRGGDRTDISLPKAQDDLIKAILATGKPVALVLLNGSALAVNYSAENVAAIVEAWYPGEAGGAAIADVLFGDYNPGGRLPVTFYKSVDQLPAFDDYSMQGRTYRYFKGEPLYPFGFGLSYTTFRYDNLKIGSKSVKAGEGVRVSVDVRNTGARAGDEVVQLYITDVSASVPVPIRSLAGIRRVFLKPGEKRNVSFELSRDQMTIIDDKGRRVIEPGEFTVSIGGKQPGFTGRADASTTGAVTGRFTVTGKAVAID